MPCTWPQPISLIWCHPKRAPCTHPAPTLHPPQALVELYLREKAFFWAASLVPLPENNNGESKTGERMGDECALFCRPLDWLARARLDAKAPPLGLVRTATARIVGQPTPTN